jgi:hypothetical protein
MRGVDPRAVPGAELMLAFGQLALSTGWGSMVSEHETSMSRFHRG